MNDQDKSLFMQEMEGVTPLAKTDKKPIHNARKDKQSQNDLVRKVKRKQHRHKQTSPKSQLNITQKHTPSVTSFQSLLYKQKGVRPQEMNKITANGCRVEAALDLHGLTAEVAEIELLQFIQHSYREKYRVIRIIHGKGYNSDAEYPILKNLTNQTLRNISEVIAFSSASEKDGGVGAINILLKAH